MLQATPRCVPIRLEFREEAMLRRYVFAFLIGWFFNFAVDVVYVTRETAAWLEHGWLAPIREIAQERALR